MSATERRKGKAGEQESARRIRVICPDVMSVRAGGETLGRRGRDLVNTPGLCVQVKKRGDPDLQGALMEAIGAAVEGEMPLAHCRRSRRGSRGELWTITLRDSDFFVLWAVCERFREAMPRRFEEIRREIVGEDA